MMDAGDARLAAVGAEIATAEGFLANSEIVTGDHAYATGVREALLWAAGERADPPC